MKRGAVPLARALSKIGIASRSRAIAMILEGRVRVDGRVIRDPGLAIVPERARIEIDGVGAGRAPWKSILFYKPRGVVTTTRDPEGRRTVFDVLGEAGEGVMPVGRLDLASTGLLLLTSDTQLAAWLTDPANAVPRTYAVTVRGEVSDDTAASMRRGARVDREILTAAVEIRKRSRRETHAIVTLTEGKNREIRRVFAAFGHEVTRLMRVAFGPLTLGDLRPGEWRVLTRAEIRAAFPAAMTIAGSPPSPPKR